MLTKSEKKLLHEAVLGIIAKEGSLVRESLSKILMSKASTLLKEKKNDIAKSYFTEVK